MSEYIEREALIAHMKDLPTWWADGGGVYGHAMKYPEGMFDCDDVINSIENAPAADVAPVVHGRWIDGKCSNCGADIPTDDAHDAIFENECHFCYYCGAKMDGKDTNVPTTKEDGND